MQQNPYQAPTSVNQAAPTSDFDPSECDGIPHEGYLAFRRGSLGLILSMLLFFVLHSADMFRDSIIEGAITLVLPIVLLFVAAKTMEKETAVEAQLTLKNYRAIASSCRGMCLWLGPVMFATGLAQLIWIPEQWYMLAWSCLAAGPAFFGCAFLWPRVEGIA